VTRASALVQSIVNAVGVAVAFVRIALIDIGTASKDSITTESGGAVVARLTLTKTLVSETFEAVRVGVARVASAFRNVLTDVIRLVIVVGLGRVRRAIRVSPVLVTRVASTSAKSRTIGALRAGGLGMAAIC